MTGAMQTATVILLNYNTRHLLLDSLQKISADLLAAGWQVIVVDNGSSDGSAQAVAARFPQVTLVVSEQNVGFAAGNNLGLQQARGDTVILLNTDVLVTAPQLQALADYLSAHPTVGAVSPGLRTAAGEPQSFAYGGDPSPRYLLRRGLRRLLRSGPLHDWAVTSPIDVDWVSGACLAVRTTAYMQVGGLDERYFLYFEDVDWCDRIRQAGWRVVYNPMIQVVHLGGQSEVKRSVANQLYMTSLRTYYQTYYPLVPAWLLGSGLRIYHTLLARQNARD
jgi:N-acetylglucosaminyl-diphospho-decaprenol L-rhamnosyltransferase